jgi:hypothetical protein
MTIRTILPPVDPSSGFWAAAARNGYDAPSLWVMASDALATVFALAPLEVRDFLDSTTGGLLADDIGFIEGGPADAAAIATLLHARLRHLGWQRLYAQTIAAIRTRDAARPTPRPKPPGTRPGFVRPVPRSRD